MIVVLSVVETDQSHLTQSFNLFRFRIKNWYRFPSTFIFIAHHVEIGIYFNIKIYDWLGHVRRSNQSILWLMLKLHSSDDRQRKLSLVCRAISKWDQAVHQIADVISDTIRLGLLKNMSHEVNFGLGGAMMLLLKTILEQGSNMSLILYSFTTHWFLLLYR